MAVNDQATVNPPVPVTTPQIEGLGLHVVYIICYVIRTKNH